VGAGLILTAFGIASVLGAVSLLRFRPRRPLLVGVPPLMLLSLPLILLAMPGSALLIAAGAVLGGFGLTLFNTLFETTVQERVLRLLCHESPRSLDAVPGPHAESVSQSWVAWQWRSAWKCLCLEQPSWLVLSTLVVLGSEH
jgi:hypothetical protein